MKSPLALSASILPLVIAALAATACSAPIGDSATAEESVGATESAQKNVYSDEHPDATCEKNILGNMICTECATGPFPSCKTYVCDSAGNNCKATTRVIKIDRLPMLPATDMISP